MYSGTPGLKDGLKQNTDIDKLQLYCCTKTSLSCLCCLKPISPHLEKSAWLQSRHKARSRITQLFEQWLHLVTVKIEPSPTPAHFPSQGNQEQQNKHTQCWNAVLCVCVHFLVNIDKRNSGNVDVVWLCQFCHYVLTCSDSDELLLV